MLLSQWHVSKVRLYGISNRTEKVIVVCDGLPFGYKAVKEVKDTESYEVDGRRQKLWDGGDGKVQRSKSEGEWVVDGLCRGRWGGDLRTTGVVSRSFKTDR